MHQDLQPGRTFPEIELPNHLGQPVTLSDLMKGWPMAIIFIRGHY